MGGILLVVLRSPSEASIITASGDPLDISIACETLRERIEAAATRLGLRIGYADVVEDVYRLIERAEEEVVVVLDALAVFADHLQALSEALDAYTGKPSDTLVLVTRPYLDRGVKLAIEDDAIVDIGRGADAFAGIIVSKRESLAAKIRGVTTLPELLAALKDPSIHYWREPWFRVERPQDPLFYAMLMASRIRGVRVAPGARVSPTVS